MATSKTRFLILQRNVEKQIFSVEEKKSGDLLIGLNTPKNAIIAGQFVEKPKFRKISIHTSPNSIPPVRTITHEIGFSLRKSHKGYAVVKQPIDGPFIWPVFCQSFGTNEPKFINRHKNDDLRKITAYNSSIDALLLAVFITSKGYAIPDARGLSVTTKEFSQFGISVVTTFADLKSGKSTVDMFPYTSPPKDGNFLGLIGGKSASDTFTIEGLELYLLETFLSLAERLRNTLYPTIAIRCDAHIQMRRYGRYDEISIDEATYGEHSIISSKRNKPNQRMNPLDSQSLAFSGNYESMKLIVSSPK